MWEALLGKHHAVVTPVGTPQAPALLVSAPGPHTVQNGTQVLTQSSVQTWGVSVHHISPSLPPRDVVLALMGGRGAGALAVGDF